MCYALCFDDEKSAEKKRLNVGEIDYKKHMLFIKIVNFFFQVDIQIMYA